MTDEQTPAANPHNWAWTVDRSGPDVDPERARMSTGHADFAPGSTPGEVADGLAMTARMNHSYRGAMDVAVWPLPDLDDMARWPRRDHRRPSDAEHFRYEALAADADPQATAVRWFTTPETTQ